MTEASSLITKCGRGKGTDSLYLEHEHFLFTAQCPSYSWYHRTVILICQFGGGVFHPRLCMPRFYVFCISLFWNCVYVYACISGGFCLFVFLMSVSCQQLLKYLCGGLPAEVHNVTSLGKFSASTNPIEKGYAFLKQLWELCARSLFDANWSNFAGVNEACWIMAAEAFKTYQMKCYTEMHSAQKHCNPCTNG